MARVYEELSDAQREWIAAQAVFFVGTAPLAADGHLNLSPKGPIGSLAVLGPREVAYLDVVGSGAETIAHLRENGRIVLMLCAFSGPPRILRLHGTGTVALPGEAAYDELLARGAFADPSRPEARRAIVHVAVQRIADACGYGVPLMDHVGEREHAVKWADKKLAVGGTGALDEYIEEKNLRSIDGLPALDAPPPRP
ncbi:pyridoxamine 5'-phosphate oxidase family protein [Paraconexibacter antarcticus]|uniref:Pyridoxamine 5'-phosphate oxidase family protein n=1 Tax=Paraconexibacter antarcticus TaxID=2949664 RepID=A0ABY5DWI0_9ACTN|nr:pyridoxamine 5'-phosphate oxidase family protein [Paraconexibacter antarcticus]UTI65222.1 pyridoxamine 5'-phosphate oxidase family protein [Paraconexibacter antarcticus]